MFKKFLKLLGVGVVSGAACRAGSMLMESLFPNGLGGFLSRFNEPEDEENRPKKRKKRKMYLPRWRG
jgi:hypothetical protein